MSNTIACQQIHAYVEFVSNKYGSINALKNNHYHRSIIELNQQI